MSNNEKNAQSPPQDSVVGCWKMVEAWDLNDPGKPGISYPWGNPPLGYWVFDSSGHCSVMISPNPALPYLGSAWWTTLAPANTVVTNMMNMYNNMYAYFGTYTVDYDAGNINIMVVADVLQQYNTPGIAQVRPFKIVDGELLVGDLVTWLRRLVRVAPA